jgi:hypothetical protein
VSSRRSIVVVGALVLLAGACHGSGGRRTGASSAPRSQTSATAVAATTTTAAALGPAIILSAQDDQLDAYGTEQPFVTQTVVPSPASDHDGVAVSGQICFDPTNPRQFVAADRTDAADGQVGWGVFTLSGHTLGKLSARETARLVPTYQPAHDSPTPFGCSFLPDGRLLTTDGGNQSRGPADGQLIEWFPPFDRDTVLSCKVDVTLSDPAGLLVDGDRVLVTESRGGGVTNFVTSTLPTSNRSTGGCATRDAGGAALAIGVVHTPWLQNAAAAGLSGAAAVVRTRDGAFYVANPRTGVIAEVDTAGRAVRRILAPPAGAVLGKRPFVTGTPMALAITSSGTLYYADSGMVLVNARLVPGLRTGTIRRIAFSGGRPQPPVVIDTGLESPNGIGVWVPSA